ncbi:MAG: ABC transporter substrate-binding protein [Spirochaetes bacterium]|nr:ABC transporter substrate-binding protein [Spirochaetota bacterium]
MTSCLNKKQSDQKIIYEEKKESEIKKINDYNVNTIKIAVIASKTGQYKMFGEDVFKIAEIIKDEINIKGGILNKKVELIELDSESSVLAAKKCAETAVLNNVTAVIGDILSSYSLAIAPILQTAKIPMISPGSTNPDLIMIGDYIFRICYNDLMQAIAIASFVYNDLNAKSAFILTNSGNKYSFSLSEHFKIHFMQLGGKILKESNCQTDVADPESLISDIKALTPDVIFIPGYPEDSFKIIKTIRNNGIKTAIIGGDGWGGDEIIKYAKNNELNNCFNTTHWHPGLMNQNIPDIIMKYEKKYNKITNPIIPLTYDSFFILFDAINRAGSTDNRLIRDEIEKTINFKGLTGKISFDHNGDTLKEIIIQKFKENKILFLKKLKIDTIKIAAIFAKPGEASVGNINILNGIRFAVDELNLKEGIKGKYIELIEYDNQNSSIISKKAAEKAVHDKVIAVIGASWSSHSLSMAPVLQNAHIPMITPTSTSPEITMVGDYIFRVCYIDSYQGSVMANFAYYDLKSKNAVILINTESKYSIELGSYFSKNFKKLGGVILWEGEYLENASDYMDIIVKIKNLDPDVVFLPGYYRDSGLIIKQARKNKIKAFFLGGDSWNKKMYSFGGNYIDGSYFSSYWHRDIKTKENINFVANFEKRFGNINTSGTAAAYDAVNILAYAINQTNVINGENIKNSIFNIKNFKGVTGKISINKFGDTDRSAVILKFEKNSIKYVKTID